MMMATGVGGGDTAPPTLLPQAQTPSLKRQLQETPQFQATLANHVGGDAAAPWTLPPAQQLPYPPVTPPQPLQPLQGPARSSGSPRDALAYSLAWMQQPSAEPLALRPSLLYHDGSRAGASRRDTSGTTDPPASRNASSSPSPSAPAAPVSVSASLDDHSPSTPAAPPPAPPDVVGDRSALCISPLTRAEAAGNATHTLVGAPALAQPQNASFLLDVDPVAPVWTQARASTLPAQPDALPPTEHLLSPLGHATPRRASVAAPSQVGAGAGIRETPLLQDTSVVAASSQDGAGFAASGEAWPSPGTVVTVTAEVLRHVLSPALYV